MYHEVVSCLFSVQAEVKLLLILDIIEKLHLLNGKVDQIISRIL